MKFSMKLIKHWTNQSTHISKAGIQRRVLEGIFKKAIEPLLKKDNHYGTVREENHMQWMFFPILCTLLVYVLHQLGLRSPLWNTFAITCKSSSIPNQHNKINRRESATTTKLGMILLPVIVSHRETYLLRASVTGMREVKTDEVGEEER